MGEGDNIPNVGNEPVVKDGGDKFAVPDTYANEGWAKDLNSNEAVWTKLAGAEKLLGAKVEGKIDLPKDGATPEDMATFYKSIGRPEEASVYTFNREGQSEALKAFNNDEMDTAVRGIFHKWGLRPDQATGIQTDYEALIGESLGTKLNAEKVTNDNFEEVTTKIFGNDKDAILESSKVLLEKYVPEPLADRVAKMDNENLTIMAAVLNGIKKDFISEDQFTNLGTKIGGMSEADLRTKAKQLMSTEEYTNQFHAKHAERKAEVDEIYEAVGKME